MIIDYVFKIKYKCIGLIWESLNLRLKCYKDSRKCIRLFYRKIDISVSKELSFKNNSSKIYTNFYNRFANKKTTKILKLKIIYIKFFNLPKNKNKIFYYISEAFI